ncbi:putative pumilio homolog 8, chloroplastic [Helianthus annuus]|uniref:putative pumilio homolog 8, chloroplastic n=1 Tax=Helianthus annuus TaxID=4232 RepID=UPI000B8FBDB8|nr:putative pumilio homolog 8, chloroplastic [Helianthus annuus]
MMVERVGIIDNMKDDEELEMLLGEIPHATSLHHHPSYANAHYHHHHMYGMYDDGDSSSSSHIVSRNPCFELPHSSLGKEVDGNLIDGLSRMYINHDQNQGLHCVNRIRSTSFRDSGYLAANPYFSRIPMNYEQSNFDRSVLNYCYQSGIAASKGKVNPNHDSHWFHMAADGSRITRGGFGFGVGVGHGLEGLAREDSLIIQGEDVSRVRKKFIRPSENGQTHLSNGQQYIFAMAKDQHGCRLLQKIFDDGNPQHVQTVFNEIIGHVVELMINPFGNYFMQKLLEVCNEEQRMRILIAVTREPRELVQISLNTHGTRVVQKLIETLKTRQQIKLVISAIEPGFLALIKDLNGNHVIQRCLQCLSNEDNKFIYEAAAKFCVEIATHQHGCCVLQRCINHSTGEYREKLVSEISKNGILLAQDAYGNYAVQYILELQIPSAVSKLTSQFKGNYVHLATQKFSSHVVEKCLAVLDGQFRSTIIRELISATQFEQLLQDPHANYVIQTALRVSEGPLHNSLVNVIESHKAISRNSPYSKRIFSHKLLRR